MHIGTRTQSLIGGRKVPGIVVGEIRDTTVQVVSKDPARGGALVNLPIQVADVVTLRETNPERGEVRKYYAKTQENLRFTFPRSEPVIGLDFDEKGDRLSVDQLLERAMDSMLEYQQLRLEASAEVVLAIPAEGQADDLTTAGL